jgi:hypothetical protein
MTRDKLLGLLHYLENGARTQGWCPSCSEHSAPFGKHANDCDLAEAIAWLEDERNTREVYERKANSPDWLVHKGWVLR